MQTSGIDADLAYKLAGLGGVIGSAVQRKPGTSPPATCGDPPSEWQRSLLRSALHAVAGVSGHGVKDIVRIESNGWVVVGQSWECHRVAVLMKMGTPHTKSLARAIRRVRNKVEPQTESNDIAEPSC